MAFNADHQGAWNTLFAHALVLMRDMLSQTRPDVIWTFGGGTVLMLRHSHRISKDIDLFVPDPQYLGFVNPRLSDVAAGISDDYIEAAEFIKLIRPEGEIDIVAAPNLTAEPWTRETIMGEIVYVETDIEIIAKKMWHRGNQVTARDLFDLVLVIKNDGPTLAKEAKWLIRHRHAFLDQISTRRNVLNVTFNAIDRAQNPTILVPDYDECVEQAREFLLSL
jgi:predicted nucleotidyltransferase component of viral defense system